MKFINHIGNNLWKAGFFCGLAFCFCGSLKAQEITKLQPLSSVYDEQHLVISDKGDLFYTIGYHPENKNGKNDPGDIWFSNKKEDGGFEAPVLIPELSTKGLDVLLGFPEDDKVLVYHNGQEKELGIHQYNLVDGQWKYEQALPIRGFSNQSRLFGGRLAATRDILIFSISSFGTYGNEDIYVSFLEENGNWSPPLNLGTDINGTGQELTPFLSSDHATLYFSSNGHDSQPGIHIYYSNRLDDSWQKWTTPRKVEKVNSDGLETSFVLDTKDSTTAFFISTQNSDGYGDIFQSEGIQPVISASLEKNQVRISAPSNIPDPEEMEPDDAVSPEMPANWVQLKVADVNTQEEIPYTLTMIDNQLKEGEAEEYQDQIWSLANSTMHIIVESTGYLPALIEGDFNQEITVNLYPLQKGSRIILENMQFQRSKAELESDQSKLYLNVLAKYLMKEPGIKILIEGHTDNVGNTELNKELSMERARSIRDYLVGRGADFEQIRIRGWGGSKPIVGNQSEEGRIKNRRVELSIVD